MCVLLAQVYDRSVLDAEREGITVCYNMLQQGVATAADMDDVDVKFRHVVEMAVSVVGVGGGGYIRDVLSLVGKSFWKDKRRWVYAPGRGGAIGGGRFALVFVALVSTLPAFICLIRFCCCMCAC